MTDPENVSGDANNQEPSRRPGGIVGWLLNPRQRRFVLPATGLWILVLDWLLFSSNILSAWLATPVVVIVGFVLGGGGAFLIQRKKASDALWLAVFKGLLAGIVVGVPWPIGGTLIGGWVLLTSGLADARKEILGK